MNYISVREAAERWEMTPRRVQVLCNDGRIDGAQRVGNVWTIPENADKPIDARKKIIAPKAKINSNITIERIWAMPNKNTFGGIVVSGNRTILYVRNYVEKTH